MQRLNLYKCWLIISLAILFLLTGCVNEDMRLFTGRDFSELGNRIIRDLPADFLADVNETFSNKNNLTPLLLVGGAGIAMYNSDADKNIYENFQRHRGFNGFTDETFNILGGPGPHFAAAGIWYMLSSANEDQVNKEKAWILLRALSVTGATTLGLKAIINNDTPNDKQWAWPSGHTSSSFTVAAVLDEFYGPAVGIPAYVGASLVAWRMMDSGDHWASDVVFGGTLGWIVGHTIAGKNELPEIAGFKILPFTSSRQPVVGINLFRQF